MLVDVKGQGYEPTLRSAHHVLTQMAELALHEERARGLKKKCCTAAEKIAEQFNPLLASAPTSEDKDSDGLAHTSGEFTQTIKGRPQANGDRVLAQLYAKLDEIDSLEYPRSHHQVKFHDCFIRACLRIIYGPDYERMEPYLQQEMDVSEFRTEVMIVTPRRFGKTFSVAQFCAAFATSVLGKEVAIFSTGRRASKKILDLVIRFMKPIMRPTQKIILRNVEEVHLLDEETKKLNKVCSYPSKVQVRSHSFVMCTKACE